MISFYPKFGAAEDAPNYRPAESEDRCETCAHFRNLGPQGYCEKFSFMCDPEYVCDDYRPAGSVKESSASEKKKKALKFGYYEDALRSLRKAFPEKKASRDRSAFLEGMHPIPGGVVTQAVQDRLDDQTTAEDMIRRRRLATAGGVLGGGLLVPGAVAAVVGGAKGAITGKGVGGRIVSAGTNAASALRGTFQASSAPALTAGGLLGGLGAREQYNVGSTLAEMAQPKTASVKMSIKHRLRKMSADGVG